MALAAFGFAALLLARPAHGEESPPRILMDFEDPADRRMVTSRKTTDLSRDVSSHGRRSMRFEVGDYLNLHLPRFGAAPRDNILKLDLFNGTPLPLPVRAEVFDSTSLRGYWYRHVREYTLRPGWNTLSFAISRLYRGEKNSRRIQNAYLAPDDIKRVDLAFEASGKRGFIYLDYVRLEPDPPMPEVKGLRAFDFGPEGQAVRHGFTPCSHETFNAARGFGWSSPGPAGLLRDYTHPNAILADFREARGDTFSVALPNGTYRVLVYYEDNGWWEDQFARFTWRTIQAEGKVAYEERLNDAQAAERFYRFADVEPMPHIDGVPDFDVYACYIRDGRYKPKELETEVKDGRLDLRFDADRPMVCRIAAIVLWPAAEQEAAAKWCAELDRRLRAEFEAENVFIDTAPRGRNINDIPENARQGLVVFSAGAVTPTGPTYVPSRDELIASMSIFCAPGEDTGAPFSIRTTASGPIKVEASIPRLRAQVFLAQNRLKRHGGGYTILPDILRPAGGRTLHAGETRQFWLEVSAPPDATPGRHDGEVAISFGKHNVKVPVAVEILPVKLSEPKMAFGLFGLMPDACTPPGTLAKVVELLRRHGMSSVAGVPIGRVRTDGGVLKVDFTEADEVMATLKAAGFALGVDTYGGDSLSGLGEAAAALKIPGSQALKQAMDQVREHAKAAGWPPLSYSMVDEPQWSDEAVEKATNYVERVATAAPWLLTNGYWSPDAGNRTHRRLMDALGRTSMSHITRKAVEYLKSQRKSIGFYGGATRHEFGLKQWAALSEGFDAHYAWHFYIRYGDLYYDLDAREPDICMVYYTPTEIRPSLQLKNVRAGAFDFRYLQTLADLAAGAAEGPALAQARELLETARKAGNLYGASSAPVITDPDAFRRKVAEAIIKLSAEKNK